MPLSLPSSTNRSTCSIINLLLLSATVCVDGFSASVQLAIPSLAAMQHRLCNQLSSSKSSSTTTLFGMDVARYVDDDGGSDTSDSSKEDAASPPRPSNEVDPPPSSLGDALRALFTWNGPPIKIDDTNLLIYDVILLTNLSVSISFFVAHRLKYFYIPSSLNEGAVLSICWLISGLNNGAFLYSAVNGHYDPSDENYAEKGGPKAAGLLAVSTFVTTCSLRIAFALLLAVVEHRPVGSGGEELIPLEIPFGLVLMSAWRMLHAEHTIR